MITAPTDIARIKAKSGITDTSMDDQIDQIWTEVSTSVDFCLLPEVVASSETSVVAVILGAKTQLAIAETLEYRARCLTLAADQSQMLLAAADRLHRRAWIMLKPFLRDRRIVSESVRTRF